MKGLNIKHITTTALPIVGGAVAAKFVKNIAGKMIANDKIRAAAPLVLGLILSSQKKTQSIGYGMIAVGGADLVGSFIPSLAGIEDLDLSGLFGNPLNDDMNSPYPLNDEVGDDIGSQEDFDNRY